MYYRRTSFLAETAPDTYRFLSELKPYALIYAGVLAVAILLSMFFQWNVVKFFIDCMMGWTLLSIPFVGVLIVALDKEILLPQAERWEPTPEKPISYKFSMIWGIILILSGITALYFSSQYKKHYSFQCQSFFLEQPTGIYHLSEKCEYIGFNEDEEPIDNVTLSKVTGKELLEYDCDFCDACREWAEDTEMEYESSRYSRR